MSSARPTPHLAPSHLLPGFHLTGLLTHAQLLAASVTSLAVSSAGKFSQQLFLGSPANATSPGTSLVPSVATGSHHVT